MADGGRLTLTEVEKCLGEVVTFIEPYLQIANAHATDFILNDFWNNLVPPNIQAELLNMTETDLKQLASLGVSSSAPNRSGDCHNVCKDGEQDINNEMIISTNNTDNTSEKNTQPPEYHTDYRSQSHILQPETKEIFSDIDDAKSEIATASDKSQNNEYDSLLIDWKHSSLEEFCRVAQDCCIDNQGLARSYEGIMLDQDRAEVFVDTFMNEKKSHEIERMANICNKLVQQHNSDLVIDFGSGKGYLGSYLNLQYDIPVLGIDAVSVNTKSAVRRTNILTKQWDGLTQRKQSQEANQARMTKTEKKRLKNCKALSSEGDIEKRKTVKSNLNRYVPVTMFIENSTDLDELVYTNFPEVCHTCTNFNLVEFSINSDTSITITEKNEKKSFCEKKNSLNSSQNENCASQQISSKIESESMESVFDEIVSLDGSDKQQSRTSMSEMSCMLTGLHTCGNLASASLELFVHSPMLKVLCNVGCCYHLLTEEFWEQRNTETATTSPYGFPMCSFLKRKKFHLGQTARNLASQSVCRLEQTELQGKKFFPRALLEVLLSRTEFESGRQGKSLRGLEQKCSSVQEFIKRACQKLGIIPKVDDSMIEDLIHQYQDQERKLAAFFQLRTVLAPCIESLIILDRVCYLLEKKSVKGVNIVKMFDPVISPRCYGILATKS